MNWYRFVFAQALQPYLQSLGVRPEVFNYITSLPSEQAQYFVNTVRKNPKMPLQELQQYVQPKPVKQVDPYFIEEKALASLWPNNIEKYVLVNFRKARQGKMNVPFSILTSPSTPNREYFHLADRITRWRRTNELGDFVESHPNFDIASYSPEDLDDLINEWHRASAGRGEGKIYGPIDPALVVYGPKWKNKENQNKQGWTIQEVRTENDLLTEGNLMSHCVGSYHNKVQRGDTRIFSLRDPTNKPHTTIETDLGIEHFEQIQGHGNSTPDAQYQIMIREWVQKLGHPAYIGEEENAVIQARFDDIEDINSRLDKIVRGQEEDEYGLKTKLYVDIEDFEQLIDYAKKAHSRSRDGDYWGPVTDSADVFVDAVLAQHGPDGIAKLQQALATYEEKAMDDVYNNWTWEPYENPPDVDAYETDAEYEKAEEEWQERMNEAENEQMQEEMGKWLPHAFIHDAFTRIRWLEEKGKLKPKKKRKTKKAVANHYYELV